MKCKWAEQVPNKEQENTVVNRGRVRHVTFGTGEKVVESAGVVRVKVSYKMIPQAISQ